MRERKRERISRKNAEGSQGFPKHKLRIGTIFFWPKEIIIKAAQLQGGEKCQITMSPRKIYG
jgi:hypothetical protein